MIEVLTTGPLATIQDLGRAGYQELGVSRSGAADQSAHRLANRLVGNADTAATIEITLGGLTVRVTAATTLALTGAHCPTRLGWHTAVSLPAGSTVALGVPRRQLRSYLAVRGGVLAEPVLGSRSHDTLSGLGPAPLRAGDVLATGTDIDGQPGDGPVHRSAPPGPIRVLLGPRADWFHDAEALLRQPWLVAPDSNRIGVRLTGSPLARSRTSELPTEPTVPGAIQVPPSGQPIVLGRDAPVTGGYPVIGVVSRDDLDRMAQLRPGESVRFRRVSDSLS